MLTAIREAEDYIDNYGRRYKKVECLCDCGKTTIVRVNDFMGGRVKSCGCYKVLVRAKENSVKSNPDVKRLYSVWNCMKTRCYNKSNPYYKDYGGRGITVCKEWLEKFRTFEKWALDNGYDSKAEFGKCTIDRIDVNGDYEPSNCRWISIKEQQNNKRNTIYLDIFGEKMTLNEVSAKYGINRNTLFARYSKGVRGNNILQSAKREKCKKTNPKEKPHRDSLKVSVNGETHSIDEWSKISEIKRSTLYNRALAGKTEESFLKTPRHKIR